LADLARETGRSKKQLSVWRRRFLAGGEAYLDGRRDHEETETLRGDRDELSERAAELEIENTMLARRVALLRADRDRDLTHPYCSDSYSRAVEEPGARSRYVPEWGAFVLIREGLGGVCRATGFQPLAPLDPSCDVKAGLEALRRDGIASVSLVVDPMWCPEPSVLQAAFDTCSTFRVHYFVDREKGIHYQKRHRNRLNQARRVGRVEEIQLAEHLGRWHDLYSQSVANHQIQQPFTQAYFEQLAALPAVRAIAVRVNGEIVAMTVWVRHWDTLYFHDGASSATGFETSAAYAAYAHAIESETSCRYVLLGGSAGFRDERLGGLAKFRRGFSNGSVHSYMCGAALAKPSG
jgi:hypothetical protein